MDYKKYLLAQDSDYLWGAVVKNIGVHKVPAGQPYPNDDHPKDYMFHPETGRILPDMQIIYITEGRGWFHSAQSPKVSIKAGDAIIIFPGVWHSYAPDPETGWTEAWIGFDGDITNRILQQHFFEAEHPVLWVGVSSLLSNAFEQALEIANAAQPAYQQQLAGYVHLIVSTVYAKSKQQPYKDNPDADKINLARKYMWDNLSYNLTMETVAQHVGLGYSKFRKLFHNYTGFSPTQYFLRLKLEKAKDYLSSTDLLCKEIAFRLGFDSASYFNKLFRQHNGITPNEFRAQQRG